MRGYFQPKKKIWVNIPVLLQIQAANPSVDTSAPAACSHLHLKFGKLKVCPGYFPEHQQPYLHVSSQCKQRPPDGLNFRAIFYLLAVTAATGLWGSMGSMLPAVLNTHYFVFLITDFIKLLQTDE